MIKHSIILMSMVLHIEKFKVDQIFFHAVVVPQTLQPCTLYKSHGRLGHNGYTILCNFI